VPSLTLDEARARSAQLRVRSYEVHLDLTDPDSFGSTTLVRFARSEVAEPMFIELVGALAISATLNGVELPATSYAEGRLTLPDLQPENELLVEARLPFVTDGDGMHTFTDPADVARYVSE
jgi:aminopeptidase N